MLFASTFHEGLKFILCFVSLISGGNAEINIEELKFNDKLPSVDLEDNDKAIKDIIQRIEELQSQVGKLKTRIDNVVSENPGKFCSVTQLSMIGSSDGFNHSRHNSASFVGNDNTFPVSFVHASSQLKSELNTEDLLLTENPLPSQDRITSFIETTIKPQLEFLQENVRVFFFFFTQGISTCMLLYFLFCLHKFVVVLDIGNWVLAIVVTREFSNAYTMLWFCLVSVTLSIHK